MKTRILSVLLLMTMLLGCITIPAAANNNDTHYIVLVLDISGGGTFSLDQGQTIAYEAKSPIEYTKQAAKKFVDQTLAGNNSIKIAIVSYHSSAQFKTQFLNDKNSLYAAIDSMYAQGQNDVDIGSGLDMAHSLFYAQNGRRDIVLLTTGMSMRSGGYSYSGKYDNTVVGSDWQLPDLGVRIYAYANDVHQSADRIKEYADIYTVGVFQTMEKAPEGVKPIAAFYRLFAKDLASDASKHYAVENIDDLTEIFANVANDIQNPSVAYSFDIKNISNPSTPKEGLININKEQWTGDVFEFTAVTSQNVSEISICGDKPDETLWHEISYDYLNQHYYLEYTDNADGTRTWTCRFGVNEPGYRTFMLKINGHETDLLTYATLRENDGSSVKPQQNTDTEEPWIYHIGCDAGNIINSRETTKVKFSATAYDNVGVAKITLIFQGNPIKTVYNTNTIELPVFIDALKLGENRISVYVEDAAGNSCQSDDFILTVTDGSFSNTPQQDAVNVTVNGSTVNFDVFPQIINGRTMIPVRAVTEALGCDVTWDGDTQTVSITGRNVKNEGWKDCYIKIGSNMMKWEDSGAWINGGKGGEIILDSPAVIIDGRTLVPIRAIAELYGYNVDWDNNNRTVIITQ